MDWSRELRFVFAEHGHWKLAGVAAAAFFGGLASAGVVVRAHLHGLMRFPLWLMSALMRFLWAFPNYFTIFLLIFLFNSTAMCVYMLTGVLPVLPHVVCFMTGMNIGIVVLVGGGVGQRLAGSVGRMPASAEGDESAPPPADPAAKGGCFRVVCFLIVVVLELPAFWFAIAMGTSIGRWWHDADPAGALGAAVIERLRAYASVIVPILAVSGAVESVGVLAGLKDMKPNGSGPPPAASPAAPGSENAGDDCADSD